MAKKKRATRGPTPEANPTLSNEESRMGVLGSVDLDCLWLGGELLVFRHFNFVYASFHQRDISGNYGPEIRWLAVVYFNRFVVGQGHAKFA